MKKSKVNKRVVYYHDPIHDDFAGTKIKTKTIQNDFKFIHKNFFWNACSLALYYLLAFPVIWFFMRVILGVKVKYADKKALKKLSNRYFLYGNHTGIVDAYIPSLITFPHRNKIVVSPDVVSIKGLSNIVQMLGAIPVPDTPTGLKNFSHALAYYHQKGHAIVIYPEAHIWPFYNQIRPFVDTSFTYPVKLEAPVVAFVTAFTKPKLKFKKAQRTIYVSAPFYPDPTLSPREAKQDLRNRVHAWMQDTTQTHSPYAYIQYLPATNHPDASK